VQLKIKYIILLLGRVFYKYQLDLVGSVVQVIYIFADFMYLLGCVGYWERHVRFPLIVDYLSLPAFLPFLLADTSKLCY